MAQKFPGSEVSWEVEWGQGGVPGVGLGLPGLPAEPWRDVPGPDFRVCGTRGPPAVRVGRRLSGCSGFCVSPGRFLAAPAGRFLLTPAVCRVSRGRAAPGPGLRRCSLPAARLLEAVPLPAPRARGGLSIRTHQTLGQSSANLVTLLVLGSLSVTSPRRGAVQGSEVARGTSLGKAVEGPSKGTTEEQTRLCRLTVDLTCGCACPGTCKGLSVTPGLSCCGERRHGGCGSPFSFPGGSTGSQRPGQDGDPG